MNLNSPESLLARYKKIWIQACKIPAVKDWVEVRAL